MKKPTRKKVLDWIRHHARQGDTAAAQRLYIDNRISWKAYSEAVNKGRKQAQAINQ